MSDTDSNKARIRIEQAIITAAYSYASALKALNNSRDDETLSGYRKAMTDLILVATELMDILP